MKPVPMLESIDRTTFPKLDLELAKVPLFPTPSQAEAGSARHGQETGRTLRLRRPTRLEDPQIIELFRVHPLCLVALDKWQPTGLCGLRRHEFAFHFLFR
jgi:hypothetical protein